MKQYCVALDQKKLIPHIEDFLVGQLNCEFLHKKRYPCSDGFIDMMFFEKLHLRTNSYTSLTIVLVCREEICYADVFSTASGEGVFNIDWGAGKSILEAAVKALEQFA